MTQEQQKPTVIITGSSGLIGSALRERLRNKYDLIGMERRPSDYEEPGVRFVAIDLGDEEKIESGLHDLAELGVDKIGAVVHLAAFYDFSGEENELYDKVTVQGTRRLLEGLREGFEVETFIFSSTMLVHKPCEPGERINEDWPIDPAWPYPRSKVQTEEVIARAKGEIPSVVLRISGVYDDYGDSIPISQQIKRIYEEDLTSHFWPGDKGAAQAFLHVDDLAAAIEKAIERRHELGDECVLLLGEDEAVPYDELQDEIGRLVHGDEWLTVEIPKPLAKVGAWLREAAPGPAPFIKPWMVDIADAYYALDISKARRVLGWQPEHSLRETLPLMVQALRQDPEAWYEHHGLGEPPEKHA